MRFKSPSASAELSPSGCLDVRNQVPAGVLGQVMSFFSIGHSHYCPAKSLRRSRRCAGSSLIEVIMSAPISSITIGGVIQAYVMSSQRVEWLACSQAANLQASQRIEQVRAAKWDSAAYPAVDEVVSTNFPTVAGLFDMPTVGVNQTYVTNVVKITTGCVNPPVKMISVECSWRSGNRGIFTNTLSVYRSSDQ